MAFNTSYTFTAIDKFTTVANSIERSLGKINVKLNKMQQMTAQINKSGVAGLKAYDKEVQHLTQTITKLQTTARKGVNLNTGMSGGGSGGSGGAGMVGGLGAGMRRFAGGYVAVKGVQEFVKAGTSMETSVAQFSAQTAIYGDRTKFFTDSAKQMAFTFKMTPQAITDGFKTGASELPALAQKGNEALAKSFTETTLKIANASQMSPEESARALAMVINSQAVDASFAGVFAEKIASSMQLGTAPISSIVQGQQNLGGVAHNAGISLDNELAMLQILNKTNLPAVSGTGLRRIIENMGQAGISFEGRDPFEVFKQVAQVIDSETDLKKKKTMQEQLFGEFGRMSLQLVTDMKAGQQLAIGISKSTGALNNANQVILDTTSKNWDQLTGSLSSLSTVIFSEFAPAINNTLQELSKQLNQASEERSRKPELQKFTKATAEWNRNPMTGKMDSLENAQKLSYLQREIIAGRETSIGALGKLNSGKVYDDQKIPQEVRVQLSLDDPLGLLKIQGVSNGANVGVNNVGTGSMLR